MGSSLFCVETNGNVCIFLKFSLTLTVFDRFFTRAVIEWQQLIIEKEKASIGMLQRMFKIGFNRAARIMDQLAQAGVVGPEEGTKPRKVLMTKEEFENYLQKGN